MVGRLRFRAASYMLIAWGGSNRRRRERVTLGLNHEQQHQELTRTDIKQVLS
jgi:hypothetical protein